MKFLLVSGLFAKWQTDKCKTAVFIECTTALQSWLEKQKFLASFSSSHHQCFLQHLQIVRHRWSKAWLANGTKWQAKCRLSFCPQQPLWWNAHFCVTISLLTKATQTKVQCFCMKKIMPLLHWQSSSTAIASQSLFAKHIQLSCFSTGVAHDSHCQLEKTAPTPTGDCGSEFCLFFTTSWNNASSTARSIWRLLLFHFDCFVRSSYNWWQLRLYWPLRTRTIGF